MIIDCTQLSLSLITFLLIVLIDVIAEITAYVELCPSISIQAVLSVNPMVMHSSGSVRPIEIVQFDS